MLKKVPMLFQTQYKFVDEKRLCLFNIRTTITKSVNDLQRPLVLYIHARPM
jgi:hypothetical protein